MEHKKIIKYSIVLGIIITSSFVAKWYWQQSTAEYATVAVLDVGQGDAIYIRSVSGQDILIDGGPDRKVLEQLGKQMPFWDRTIELMVLTHPHADHINGLITLFDYYQVKQVLLTKLNREHDPTYQAFLTQIKKQASQVQYAQANDIIQLGNNEQLNIIYPFANTLLDNIENLNDTSIILDYQFGEHNILLTGDASVELEQQLINNQKLFDIDILKVGHHGSKYSSSEAFLQAIKPELAVLSVGTGNSFGHPAPEALQRLKNSEILRTDQLGDIVFHVTTADIDLIR
ncbi:MAG: MBL fold metallo-hydrolase [Patescibacteria group bacterium]|jgi:competence protein ComEC